MKDVLTFTVVSGTKACPNNCPICISKMTKSHGIGSEKIPIDFECLYKSIRIALNHNCQNVLITGKGEPMLYPGQITQYLTAFRGKPFDKIELQTSGQGLLGNVEFLEAWRTLGLDYIAISVYHYDEKKNFEGFFTSATYDLDQTITLLHDLGYKVRISCVMREGFVDSPDEVGNLIGWAKSHYIEQLSLRRMDTPADPQDMGTVKSIENSQLSPGAFRGIVDYIRTRGALCDKLPHGAEVYEVEDQNVCITTGLTVDPEGDELRQLIFFPQGILTSSWVTVFGSRIL